MITQKHILAIGIGILILLSGAKLMASDENVTLQSEDENPEPEDVSQTTDDINPPLPTEEEQIFPPEGQQFFPGRMGGFGRRRGGGNQLFGIDRGFGPVPLRASLQLGGYLADELRYLYGGGEFGWNRGRYSWQTQANYQINWVGREFESRFTNFTNRTNMPTEFSFPTGMPNRRNNPSQSVSEQDTPETVSKQDTSETVSEQTTFEMMSSDYQTLSAETRLDYSLARRFFLFGFTSLRLETDSLDRVFVGTGVGKDLFRNMKLDLGIGLTRFFGEDVTQQNTEEISTETQDTTEITGLSTLTWRRRISRRIFMDITGRTYWYVQEKSASAELNLGANLGITRRLSLRPSLVMEYLGAEREGDPFQYQFRASLVYRFQPRMAERE